MRDLESRRRAKASKRRRCNVCGFDKKFLYDGTCENCIERTYRNPTGLKGQPKPDIERRIEYYQARAALGLDLFDPPFSCLTLRT